MANSKRIMTTNVAGKVQRLSLATHKGIFTIYEAVVNAVHSIYASEENKGEINIEILRDKNSLFSSPTNPPSKAIPSNEINYIKHIIITDNGQGFTQKNIEHFCSAETLHKAETGGKGVGRFTWLKVFDYVSIESIYEENGNYMRKTFDFKCTENGIENYYEEIIQKTPLKTTIKLCSLKEDFAKYFPANLSDISKQIIEHHLALFVDNNCPKVRICETDREDKIFSINLNDEFNRNTLKTHTKSITIDKHSFDIQFIKVRSNETNSNLHSVLYCADKRVVISEKMSEQLPDINKSLYDMESNTYFHLLVLVSSNYLNQYVNSERTRFGFPERKKKNEADSFLLSLEEIENVITQELSIELSPYIESVKKDKIAQIKQYVNQKAPQYRALLNHPKYLGDVPTGLTDEKLDIALYKVKSQLILDAKAEMAELSKDVFDADNSLEEIQEKFKECIEKTNSVGASSLVDYIIHRNITINLFESALKKNQSTGKYEYESVIHDLIFPRYHTSNDLDFDKQNLWLIDEKLAYHNYLASDISLNGKKDGHRPDLLVAFDNTLVWTDDKKQPYQSIVLVEFKRPMRNDYISNDDEKDPIEQLFTYIDYLNSEKATDKDGSPIIISGNCRFYCYLVCDLSTSLKKIIPRKGFFQPTYDGLGYYGFNKDYSAYFEVISFTKLLQDAQQRNRILFDKLCLVTK